jgi:hypothetical protein
LSAARNVDSINNVPCPAKLKYVRLKVTSKKDKPEHKRYEDEPGYKATSK